jgi:GntR family transcriptional regulator of gluconate operon
MNAVQIETVQAEALWERVVTALRRAIVMGEMPPGSHLKEPLLAQRFGVSRLPVREAIAQLDREGLVRIEPRRGAFVIGIDEQDIEDIYECRLMIETVAIRRTARTIQPESIGALETLVVQMDEAVATTQPQLLAASDMDFHRTIVTLSGNRALVKAWEPVAPLIQTILGISDATCSSAELPEAVNGHRKIIRALANHDAAAAEALLEVHLQGGQELVFGALRSVRPDDAWGQAR